LVYKVSKICYYFSSYDKMNETRKLWRREWPIKASPVASPKTATKRRWIERLDDASASCRVWGVSLLSHDPQTRPPNIKIFLYLFFAFSFQYIEGICM
jgi:hypothetical protein